MPHTKAVLHPSPEEEEETQEEADVADVDIESVAAEENTEA